MGYEALISGKNGGAVAVSEAPSREQDVSNDPALERWVAWVFWGTMCVVTLGWGLVYIVVWHTINGLAHVGDWGLEQFHDWRFD